MPHSIQLVSFIPTAHLKSLLYELQLIFTTSQLIGLKSGYLLLMGIHWDRLLFEMLIRLIRIIDWKILFFELYYLGLINGILIDISIYRWEMIGLRLFTKSSTEIKMIWLG